MDERVVVMEVVWEGEETVVEVWVVVVKEAEMEEVAQEEEMVVVVMD